MWRGKMEVEHVVVDVEIPSDPIVELIKQRVNIEKESSQVPQQLEGIPYLKKRVSNADLFLFMDINTWHRRCIEVKTGLIAGLGWRLEDGLGQVLYDSVSGRESDMGEFAPILEFLLGPNEAGDTIDEILKNFLVDFFGCGDGYLELVPRRGGGLGELYHVPSLGMWRSGTLDRYFQRVNGVEQLFMAYNRRSGLNGRDSVIYHKLSYDPFNAAYGMPEWYGSMAEMGLHRSITEFNLALFKNSFMASMAVVVRGGKLSTTGRAAIKNFIANTLTGVENAGRVLLLESENDRTEISFEKMQLELSDFIVVNAQLYYRDAIVAASGVPPRMLGIVTAGQLGGSGEIEGQLKTFQQTVLKPYARQVEQMMRMFIRDVAAPYGIKKPPIFRLNQMDLMTLAERAAAAEVLTDLPDDAMAAVNREIV